MNITHMSYSRYQCWKLCQLQYKYRYHLNLKTDIEEPFYFVYGTIVHKIAQEYVAAKGDRLISEVASDVLNGVIEYEDGKKAPKLPAEYKRKLPDHLNAIKKLTDKTGFGGELEYQFRYDLDPPHGRYVVGFIDRLIKQGDSYWIIDYKTTKQGPWRRSSKDIATDLQLKCYARVIQKRFKAEPENIKCALHYLEGNELIGACFSKESLDSAEQDLLQAYLQIHETQPENARANVGPHCQRCDYRKICPWYGGEDINEIIKG